MISMRGSLRLACWGLPALLALLMWTGCSGGGSKTVSVNLTAAPEGARLQWTSKNASVVESSNFGAAAVSGMKDIFPTETTVYTITVSNGSSSATDSVTVTLQNEPPAPQPGFLPTEPFRVHTANYYYLYTTQTSPFPANYQLSSGLYPASCSYESIADPPPGFDLKTESERSIIVLAEADARISIVSGVPPDNARIKVSLVESISYGGQSNIIGLTKVVMSGGTPFYDVSVVTRDPSGGGPMPFFEIQRTLTHEFGHVFGLGHAPDTRDLMHFQSNANQGATPATFMTLGDAGAQWATLNARSIVWFPARPTITQAGGSTRFRSEPGFRHKHVTDEDGVVICVWPR